jgi:hypothetical protein
MATTSPALAASSACRFSHLAVDLTASARQASASPPTADTVLHLGIGRLEGGQMNQATTTPAHIESLARKLEAWVATDLVDSERDALREILMEAIDEGDEVRAFMFDSGFGPIVVQAYESNIDKARQQTATNSIDKIRG